MTPRLCRGNARKEMPILPIDTGRYSSPEMRLVFEEQTRLPKWLESAVAEIEDALASETYLGAAPQLVSKALNEKTVRIPFSA